MNLIIKKVTILFLVLVVGIQPMTKMMIYVVFKINQQEIAANLCIKKNIPNNTCKGNCQLKKGLEKAEKQSQKQSQENSKDKIEYVKSFYLLQFNYTKTVFARIIYIIKYSNIFYKKSLIADIFHPPQIHFIY